ncbi:MAG: threonylcarbamoyl-AMP synthase [Nitrospirae bacterium]|nr:threonylcarbamoyl-AMP synthase [Nitrospirota bacterium]
MLLKLTDKNIEDVIKAAISVLNNDGVIAYPTETFYGIGAKYNSERALKRIFILKKRREGNAMPLIIGAAEQLPAVVSCIGKKEKELINRFWPGPLTILFKAKKNLSKYIMRNNRVAVRAPGESFALLLARAAGFPITASSANISGFPPSDTASMAMDYFNGDVDLIIDGGKTKGGEPSTIVSVSMNAIHVMRRGATVIPQ